MKRFSLLLIVALVVMFMGNIIVNYKLPTNPAFTQMTTVDLFSNVGQTSDSVTLERVAAKSNSKYSSYRVKVYRVGPDTLLSKHFQLNSSWLTIRGSVDSLSRGAAGNDNVSAKLYFGKYVGLAFGDSLGFKWYLLETFTQGGADTFQYRLKDSTWMTNDAAPYGGLKIEEGDSNVLGWNFDVFNYKGGN